MGRRRNGEVIGVKKKCAYNVRKVPRIQECSPDDVGKVWDVLIQVFMVQRSHDDVLQEESINQSFHLSVQSCSIMPALVQQVYKESDM